MSRKKTEEAVKISKGDQILSELKSLGAQNGGVVNPAHVVEFARDPTTALHSRFDWDDGSAAEKYRIWQARQLISVFVTVIEGTTDPVRVWASLPDDREEEGGYRLTIDVLRDPLGRRQLLDTALRELEVFQRKYSALTELAKLFAAIKAVKRPSHRESSRGAKRQAVHA